MIVKVKFGQGGGWEWVHNTKAKFFQANIFSHSICFYKSCSSFREIDEILSFLPCTFIVKLMEYSIRLFMHSMSKLKICVKLCVWVISLWSDKFLKKKIHLLSHAVNTTWQSHRHSCKLNNTIQNKMYKTSSHNC